MSINLWELPEEILFQIISFAAGPTHRAFLICHRLGRLCRVARKTFLNESSPIWDALLVEDYGVSKAHGVTKRSSKRLRQSCVQRVRDAHLMVKDNTEIAYFYLSEACVSTGKDKLSRRRLCGLLEEYGPHLRINSRISTGGTFLVECCRARHVKESVILKCVQELVEQQNARVNLSSSETPPHKLTALCVASARGMPTIVRYLLKVGASPGIRCTGRFRLYKRARRTVKCTDSLPLDFARTIRDAEQAEGASENDLRDLNKCIKLLETAG